MNEFQYKAQINYKIYTSDKGNKKMRQKKFTTTTAKTSSTNLIVARPVTSVMHSSGVQNGML